MHKKFLQTSKKRAILGFTFLTVVSIGHSSTANKVLLDLNERDSWEVGRRLDLYFMRTNSDVTNYDDVPSVLCKRVPVEVNYTAPSGWTERIYTVDKAIWDTGVGDEHFSRVIWYLWDDTLLSDKVLYGNIWPINLQWAENDAERVFRLNIQHAQELSQYDRVKQQREFKTRIKEHDYEGISDGNHDRSFVCERCGMEKPLNDAELSGESIRDQVDQPTLSSYTEVNIGTNIPQATPTPYPTMGIEVELPPDHSDSSCNMQ